MLIAGDIGGTKTLLGLYDDASGPRAPLLERSYPSAHYPGLVEIVRQFLIDAGDRVAAPPSVACFDVAGPVLDGRAHLTNLPWNLDEREMATALGLRRVVLINDLLGVAYAVPLLQAADLHTLNAGRPDPAGAIAVIAPGTGLGEAFLVRDGARVVACSSEGGHADFAPTDAQQAALWQFAAARFGHVAYERVCSGSGIPTLYEFLCTTMRERDPAPFAAALAAAPDHTPLLVHAGMEAAAEHPVAAAALDLFVAILGAEAGNLALKVLATGGVYIAGGMPLRVLSRLDSGPFMAAFTRKGRFSDLLATVPVNVVTTDAALLGAAAHGMEHLRAG